MKEIKYLHSITEIKPEHCYDTKGSQPMRVFCSDFNYYVCKYNKRGSGFASGLFNEYIAASFLKIWKLLVPDFAFVSINKDHVLQTPYPFHYFNQEGFGSKFIGKNTDVNKLFIETPLIKKENITGRNSFLKIAMFDIWLCNEDRHYENFNMLYNLKENIFVPIDHVYCFNSNNLDKELSLISNNESILSTPFLSRFFDRNLQTISDQLRLSIIDEFQINVNRCYEELNTILAKTPITWEPDTGFLESRLQFLFSEQWLRTCKEYFTELYFLNIKTQ